MKVKKIIIGQAIAAKLKLQYSPDEKVLLDNFCFAYRDGLSYASEIAFKNKKTSNASKIQKLIYETLRGKYKLPSQTACSVCNQVGSTYKGLWTKLKQSAESIKLGHTKKRYKGLDQAPKFISRTATLQYKKDFGFKKDQMVSIQTLDGRIVVRYTGYQKHLNWIQSGERIGAAKIYYCKSSKQYYLLVTIEVKTTEVDITKVKKIKSVDVGQRNLAVTQDNKGGVKFYNGRNVLHQANKFSILRKALQKKGTRSATRKLIELSKRERRFKAQVNHGVANEIVEPEAMIGMEELTNIRERTAKKRRKGKRASVKQRRANANNSKWAYAELQTFIAYKEKLLGGIAVKVDADYSSQCCTKCGHTSKGNRPNGSVMFKCEKCGYELHSDLIGEGIWK